MQVALQLILMAAAASPAPARAATVPVSKSPTVAVQCLASAFNQRALEDYIGLLTADYQFHISPSDKVARYVDGIDRKFEMESASNLLRGTGSQPAAAEIHMTVDGISEAKDPEHPDSSAWYRVVVVRQLVITLITGDGSYVKVGPGLHVFHLVRGDAAARVAGQPGGAGRWYIRRWLEDLDGVTAALADSTGGCGEAAIKPASAVAPGGAGAPALEGRTVPTSLAIRPLGNPACPALEIQCDLPGNEPAAIEVYDVQGRLVNRRDLSNVTAGTVPVEAGAGASLRPGVYWVRLSQASRHSTRMVVVAR